MIADRFWELLSKKVSNEATEAELCELDDIIASHPDWKNTSDTFTHLWQQSTPLTITEADQSFDLHIERMKKIGIGINEFHENNEIEIWEEERKRRRKKRITIFSLSALAVLLVSIFVVQNGRVQAVNATTSRPLSQVTTKPGSKTQVQLPDGSTVWLNAASNLTYDKEFGKNLREVNLVGEAFFDVVKDPAHPFIIHTKVIDVKVLGTQFNVRSYANDATTETSLIRGSVEVTVKNRGETYHLKPNEKFVIANNIVENVPRDITLPKKKPELKSLIAIQPLNYYQVDSTILETSWVDNRLIFQKNESFREVALKMERWYGIHISFASEKVAEYRPFGSFSTETITQALDALKEGFRFNYKKTGDNQIVISE